MADKIRPLSIVSPKRLFDKSDLILRSREAASRRMFQEAREPSGASFETPFLTKWLLRVWPIMS